MKSIKPGRAPSLQGGIMGIFMICFGIIWTILAAQASILFAVIGVLWTCMAVVTTFFNFKNAKSENRYSMYDITVDDEEPDPLNEKFGGKEAGDAPAPDAARSGASRFCPWCGTKLDADYAFCNQCGKKLP